MVRGKCAKAKLVGGFIPEQESSTSVLQWSAPRHTLCKLKSSLILNWAQHTPSSSSFVDLQPIDGSVSRFERPSPKQA